VSAFLRFYRTLAPYAITFALGWCAGCFYAGLTIGLTA
jgi:hypothetical protein